jgi:hypothetical protein
MNDCGVIAESQPVVAGTDKKTAINLCPYLCQSGMSDRYDSFPAYIQFDYIVASHFLHFCPYMESHQL